MIKISFLVSYISWITVVEGLFFGCCSCPQPFRSNCPVASSSASTGYYPVQQQPVAVHYDHPSPIVIEKPVPVYVPHYVGSYDPFEPVEVETVYVPVIYRPRPIVYQPVQIIEPPGPSPTTVKPKEKEACYINDSGFKCCNTDLEKTMHGAYSALKRSPTFNECNIGLMTKVVQKASQKRFRLSFEVVVSLKEFGANSAYEGNYTCRFERDGKHFMSYASPVQYDTEDAKSENTLSQTDITHDEDDTAPTEEEKVQRIGILNEGLKDVKSTGIEIKERIRRAAENGVQAFVKDECLIEFDKVNATSTKGFVTHEVTMGSFGTTISRRPKTNGTC